MTATVQKNDYPKASKDLVYGAVLTYIAGLMLLIAFCSPYWVKSFDETFSEFKNMGLWHYCFQGFRFPNYQFDRLFNGCHHIFSYEYYVIREWLLPPWLSAVQAFVTMSLLMSFSAQVIMAFQICRWPLEFVLRYEWILSAINFVYACTTTVFMFLAVVIFAASHTRRDWLLYPNWNYLCWSYGLACLSAIFHAFAGIFLYKEAKSSYELRQKSKNLVMQMYPEQPQQFARW